MVDPRERQTKIYMTWKEFDQAISHLMRKLIGVSFDSFYGIPRGGLVVAVALSNHMGKPLLREPEIRTVIVDDICDTGMTMRRYSSFTRVVLVAKRCSKRFVDYYYIIAQENQWIVFPWEPRE